MSMEESISLEETNKIRISLGLKPLTDDKAPTDDKEKQAEDNYQNQRNKETKERETKYVDVLRVLFWWLWLTHFSTGRSKTALQSKYSDHFVSLVSRFYHFLGL